MKVLMSLKKKKTYLSSIFSFNMFDHVCMTNVAYKFKCLLGECFSNKIRIYISRTTTTMLRHLTHHISDTSPMSQHLKTHCTSPTNTKKILTENTTLLHWGINKLKHQILEALYIKINKPSLNKINLKFSKHILKCL